MLRRRFILTALTLFLCLAFANMVLAAEVETDESTDSGKAKFFIAPYGWLMGMNATVGAKGYTTKVDSSFSDGFDKVDFAGMLAMEAVWHNRYGIMANLNLVQLKDQGAYHGIELNGGTDIFFGSAALFYRVISQPLKRHPSAYANFDLIAGINYWDVGLDLTVDIPTQNTLRVSKSANWVDPIVGARMQIRFNDDWTFVLQGHVGKGGDTESTWDAAARFGYRIGNGTSLAIGYRAVNVNRRESNGFVFNSTLHGPVIGLVFTF